MSTIKTWQERLHEYKEGVFSLKPDPIHFAKEEIAELRAALAARATPAQTLSDERIDQIATDFVPGRTVTAGMLRRFARAIEWEIGHVTGVTTPAQPVPEKLAQPKPCPRCKNDAPTINSSASVRLSEIHCGDCGFVLQRPVDEDAIITIWNVLPRQMTDEKISHFIENADGVRCVDGEYRIEGRDLMNLVRALLSEAAALAEQQGQPKKMPGPLKSCGNCKHGDLTPVEHCGTCFSDPYSLTRNKLQNWEAKSAAPSIAQDGQCRADGRCQYAIDHGAEGMAACPVGKCCMPDGRKSETDHD